MPYATLRRARGFCEYQLAGGGGSLAGVGTGVGGGVVVNAVR
ncbi:hypothetical protein [Streptomyces sp. NPDC054765]